MELGCGFGGGVSSELGEGLVPCSCPDGQEPLIAARLGGGEVDRQPGTLTSTGMRVGERVDMNCL